MDADAIVIGAGAAGLAAARRLARANFSVILLEARDRVGGRVLSERAGSTGHFAELGAEFIHGSAAETMELLREANLSSVSTEGESWVCGDDGRLRREERDFAGTTGGIFEKTSALEKDESVADFLRRFEHDPAMRESVRAARSFVEGFDAADPQIASARAIADELRSGVDSKSARPAGSYHGMFKELEKACIREGVELSLRTMVRRIAWSRGDVIVETTSDAHTETVRARTAIVTLPAGVLQFRGDETAVVFEPGLPQAKLEALRYIEMGHVVKLALQFRSRFWERIEGGRYRAAAFFRPANDAFAAYWVQDPLHGTIVTAWAGGPKARAIEDLGDAALIERAVNGLGTMLGAVELAREELEGAIHHDWTHDPFSRGAYSYVRVGGRNVREQLAEPLDSAVFFAGEATATGGEGGTVNGALATGYKAAARAVRALRG